MTTPYDRVADRFIRADKELDDLPVRREAENAEACGENQGPQITGGLFGSRWCGYHQLLLLKRDPRHGLTNSD